MIYVSSLSRLLILGAIVLVGASYAGWQLFSLTSAPRLTIHTPEPLSVVNTPLIIVSGEAQNDATVFINGEATPLIDGRRFEKKIYLQEGFNSIDISALNGFSNEAAEQRRVYYQPE